MTFIFLHICRIGEESDIIRLESEHEITATELNKIMNENGRPFILDVREPHELEICQFPDAKLIPLNQLSTHIHELDRNSEIVVFCRSGVRSAKAVKSLREAGFEKVKNLIGGILSWSDEYD